MADLGSAPKCSQSGAPALPRSAMPNIIERIITQKCPSTITPATSRPDAIIILEREAPGILLVEFKYCKDTQPNDQLQKCHKQHEALISALKQALPNHSIQLVPILIGHSGTVYKSHTISNMKKLGIEGRNALKCATKMHLDVVAQLHSIVKTRRYLEGIPTAASRPHSPLDRPHLKRHRADHKPP